MAQPRKRPPTAHRTPSRTTAGTGAPLQDAAPYREFFENANDALALFHPDGTIALVNRAAERLLGYTRAELLEVLGSLGAPTLKAYLAQEIKPPEASEMRPRPSPRPAVAVGESVYT